VALEAFIQGNYPVAIVNAQKALCLDPLGEECFLLLKQSKARIGIVEKEESNRDSAISKSDQQNLFASGMQYYLQKDYVNAKRQWEFLKIVNSAYPELNQLLSQLAIEKSSADSLEKLNAKAFKYFQKAIKLYGDGNKKGALNYIDTTLQIYPGQIEGLTLKSRIISELQSEYQYIFNYGKAVYSSGEYKKAIDIWTKGVSLPVNNNTLKNLIQEAEKQIVEMKKLYLLEAQGCSSKGDITCALENYRNALNLTPADSSITGQISRLQTKRESDKNSKYQSALEKYNSGDFTKAADLFTQLLVIAPDYGPAKEYLNLCNTKIRKQSISEKKENFRKNAQEMENQNNLTEALYNWNQVLEIDSAASDAQEAFKRLTGKIEQKQKMMAVDNMYSKSMDLYKNGRYQEARDMWDMILQKDPGNVQIKQMLEDIESKKQSILQKGDAYFSKGLYAQADKEYNDVLKINPGNPVIRQKIDQAEKKRELEEIESKKIPPVEKDKQSLSSKEIENLFNKGLEFYMSQQFDKALENWNIILTKDPENSRAKSYVNNLISKMKKLNQL
jgi:tetratricopeptide (TPR) repeat protein